MSIDSPREKFVFSDCEDPERPASPRFGPKVISTTIHESTSTDEVLSDDTIKSDGCEFRRPSTPPLPTKAIKSSKKGKRIGDFIMSDCEEVDGRTSPNFGPKRKQMKETFSESIRSEGDGAMCDDGNIEMTSTPSRPRKFVEDHMTPPKELIPLSFENNGIDIDRLLIDTGDEERIDLCSAIKSSRRGLKFDINANEEGATETEIATSQDDEVIEVFVEDEANKMEENVRLDYQSLDKSKDDIVSEIISKTRPNIDYFNHDLDDECSYLHMGPVTEKELRKSEKRIKKLLKGGLLDVSHIHKGTRTSTDTSYMSECEMDYTRHISNSSSKDSSGYCSAPETENRRRRLQKIFAKSTEKADTKKPIGEVKPMVNMRSEASASSPTKRLSAEETRCLLKDFVAKKIEERAKSPTVSNDANNDGDDELIDQAESFVPSAYAQVKYVPTCKANVTSTKLCRGSVSSIHSSEANSTSPPASEISYDKADTISMASYAGSEAGNDVPALGGADKAARRRRSPIKIHYRWSTVFEEDEKSKQGSQKAINSTDKQDQKKTKSSKKTELLSKAGPSKSPKIESKKSPKLDQKHIKKLKGVAESPRSPQRLSVEDRLKSSDVGNSRNSVSGCSEMSESSGIASNDNSSLSQHSMQGSPLASVRDDIICASQSPVSPRTRRWFFR